MLESEWPCPPAITSSAISKSRRPRRVIRACLLGLSILPGAHGAPHPAPVPSPAPVRGSYQGTGALGPFGVQISSMIIGGATLLGIHQINQGTLDIGKVQERAQRRIEKKRDKVEKEEDNARKFAERQMKLNEKNPDTAQLDLAALHVEMTGLTGKLDGLKSDLRELRRNARSSAASSRGGDPLNTATHANMSTWQEESHRTEASLHGTSQSQTSTHGNLESSTIRTAPETEINDQFGPQTGLGRRPNDTRAASEASSDPPKKPVRKPRLLPREELLKNPNPGATMTVFRYVDGLHGVGGPLLNNPLELKVVNEDYVTEKATQDRNAKERQNRHVKRLNDREDLKNYQTLHLEHKKVIHDYANAPWFGWTEASRREKEEAREKFRRTIKPNPETTTLGKVKDSQLWYWTKGYFGALPKPEKSDTESTSTVRTWSEHRKGFEENIARVSTHGQAEVDREKRKNYNARKKKNSGGKQKAPLYESLQRRLENKRRKRYGEPFEKYAELKKQITAGHARERAQRKKDQLEKYRANPEHEARPVDTTSSSSSGDDNGSHKPREGLRRRGGASGEHNSDDHGSGHNGHHGPGAGGTEGRDSGGGGGGAGEKKSWFGSMLPKKAPPALDDVGGPRGKGGGWLQMISRNIPGRNKHPVPDIEKGATHSAHEEPQRSHSSTTDADMSVLVSNPETGHPLHTGHYGPSAVQDPRRGPPRGAQAVGSEQGRPLRHGDLPGGKIPMYGSEASHLATVQESPADRQKNAPSSKAQNWDPSMTLVGRAQHNERSRLLLENRPHNQEPPQNGSPAPAGAAHPVSGSHLLHTPQEPLDTHHDILPTHNDFPLTSHALAQHEAGFQQPRLTESTLKNLDRTEPPPAVPSGLSDARSSGPASKSSPPGGLLSQAKQQVKKLLPSGRKGTADKSSTGPDPSTQSKSNPSQREPLLRTVSGGSHTSDKAHHSNGSEAPEAMAIVPYSPRAASVDSLGKFTGLTDYIPLKGQRPKKGPLDIVDTQAMLPPLAGVDARPDDPAHRARSPPAFLPKPPKPVRRLVTENSSSSDGSSHSSVSGRSGGYSTAGRHEETQSLLSTEHRGSEYHHGDSDSSGGRGQRQASPDRSSRDSQGRRSSTPPDDHPRQLQRHNSHSDSDSDVPPSGIRGGAINTAANVRLPQAQPQGNRQSGFESQGNRDRQQQSGSQWTRTRATSGSHQALWESHRGGPSQRPIVPSGSSGQGIHQAPSTARGRSSPGVSASSSQLVTGSSRSSSLGAHALQSERLPATITQVGSRQSSLAAAREMKGGRVAAVGNAVAAVSKLASSARKEHPPPTQARAQSPLQRSNSGSSQGSETSLLGQRRTPSDGSARLQKVEGNLRTAPDTNRPGTRNAPPPSPPPDTFVHGGSQPRPNRMAPAPGSISIQRTSILRDQPVQRTIPPPPPGKPLSPNSVPLQGNPRAPPPASKSPPASSGTRKRKDAKTS